MVLAGLGSVMVEVFYSNLYVHVQVVGHRTCRGMALSCRPMSSINTRTYESVPAQTVAFLGLGVMGGPMAGHLAKAGHSVTVYNRTLQGTGTGPPSWARPGAMPPPRAKQPPAPTSCSAASATTTTCAPRYWATTALSPA